MLYMLGTLTIDTRPFSIDEMQRTASADIASKPLINAFPGKEFTGEGDDEITLSGQILPTKIGGMNELEIAHEMRRNGTRFPLQRGDGTRLGWFAITRITENHTNLTRNGVGFVLKHTIVMTRVQPDAGSGQQIISGLLSLFGIF
ncbi:phage tail protein [Brucella anthropi]|uniref:phage tail protein n=1 Tax=Brucella/Ochrobactrum group TaxID=2826938 RepID=UPI00124C26CA|nr:phage tail protein [Brucella anthropi]KAB2779423.1 phage tail protein [Brucella anthropi]MCH4540213.1 phage tail protein [Ochrobactrum sp. A-1]MCR5941117.1 phage tail protein [Ochrobactrum sp. XJ1]